MTSDITLGAMAAGSIVVKRNGEQIGLVWWDSIHEEYCAESNMGAEIGRSPLRTAAIDLITRNGE